MVGPAGGPGAAALATVAQEDNPGNEHVQVLLRQMAARLVLGHVSSSGVAC